MSLLSISGASLSFAGPNLLDGLSLSIEENEHICLIGRNGAGKSTLMKIILGEQKIDSGDVLRKQGLKVNILNQTVPTGEHGTVFEVVANGLGQKGKAIIDYHKKQLSVENDPSTKNLNELEKAQSKMDDIEGWQLMTDIETMISKMMLEPELKFSSLSAGLKRRSLLAQALISEPDILLLDEPTNHLDIESIQWLEKFLSRYNGTIFFVTHDRAFLQTIATRIVELDRGQIMNYECDYNTYLERKEEVLAAEDKQNALFDKRLAEEEAWIRKGIKARRTRNEGRVRALKKMREERNGRKNRTGDVKMQIQNAEKSGRVVIKAKDISFSYDDSKVIVPKFTSTIMRGDKVAIIGSNGTGKTTLINLLLNKLKPNSGRVEHGTNLSIAYFDQLHLQIDESKTIYDNIAEGSDYVTINGKSKHVLSYLQDFLFKPQIARGPSSNLSGGERNRLLLAKMFTKPSNVMVLDEPTNDLDAETLELLEEMIFNYEGTVLFVSHDRSFINNIATSSIVFENGGLNEYVGGYDDWLRQAAVSSKEAEVNESKSMNEEKNVSTLTDKERKELFNLPKKIEQLEKQQEKLHAKMAEDGFYEKPEKEIAKVTSELESLDTEIASVYERWEVLEAKS